MADHTYKFNINMSCGGCSGAVTNSLEKLKAAQADYSSSTIKSFKVDLEQQNATIITGPDLAYETVLGAIAKTKKKITAGQADGESRSVDV